MTDYQAYMRTAARGELAVDELLHYGVKGMKWGVRKAERKTSEITAKADKLDAEVARLKGQASQETNPAARKKLGKKIIAKEAEAFAVRNKPGMGGGNANGHDANLTWRQRVKDDKWRQEVNYNPRDRRQRNLFQKSEKYVDKDAIASVNNKPEYKNLDHTKSSPLKAKYDNEMNDIRAKALTDYTRKVYGLNPSKTKQKVWVWNPKTQSFGSEMRAVKHSSDEEDVLEIVAVDYTDDRGRVTGFGFASLEEFLAVAHSELSSDADLFHYGVKGMKWGVRKSDDEGGEPRQRGKIRRGMTKLGDARNAGANVMNERDAKKMPVLPSQYLQEARNQAAGRIQSAAMDINQQARFKGKDIKYDPPLREAYRKEVEKHAKRIYDEEISAAYGRAGVDLAVTLTKAAFDYKNAKATLGLEDPERQANIEKAGSAAKKVLDDARVKHSAIEKDFVLEFTYDSLGQIKTTTYGDKELKHYGVKGMKWGVRRTEAQLARDRAEVTVTQKKPGTFAKATGGKGLPVSDDAVTALEIRQRAKRSTTDALSNRDLQVAITRMNLEQQYNNLAFQSDRRSKGRRFAQGLLGQKRYGKKRPYADSSEEVGEKVRTAIDMALEARRS